MEEFEEIKGFEEYQINRKGEIKGKFGGLLNPSISDGYLNIKLYKDGKKYTKKVHRLLGIQYIPNPDNLPEIDHIDRNKINNDLFEVFNKYEDQKEMENLESMMWQHFQEINASN